MENTLYWIWLTIKPALRPSKIELLLEKFGSVEEIYKAKSYRDIMSQNEAESLLDKDLNAAKEILKATQNLGGRVITYDSSEYPEKLRNITPPPYILYVRGEAIDFDKCLTIGVIGARECTDYGRLATNRISSELARRGVIIVSGMARGLDSVAAKAALRQGAKTVAVIGCGLDIVYPREHKDLMEDIARRGMVITEYPIGSPPSRTHFPERNRIIAGLSNGVLVTEAHKGSGSLITANFALENGRDVFAVPGNVYDSAYYGSNKLIQQCAKLVMTADDIMSEYPYAVLEKIPQTVIKEEPLKKPDTPKNLKGLADDDKKIVSCLYDTDLNIDEIAEKTGIAAGMLNVKMTMLEMKGIVKKLPGNNYKLNI